LVSFAPAGEMLDKTTPKVSSLSIPSSFKRISTVIVFSVSPFSNYKVPLFGKKSTSI